MVTPACLVLLSLHWHVGVWLSIGRVRKELHLTDTWFWVMCPSVCCRVSHSLKLRLSPRSRNRSTFPRILPIIAVVLRSIRSTRIVTSSSGIAGFLGRRALSACGKRGICCDCMTGSWFRRTVICSATLCLSLLSSCNVVKDSLPNSCVALVRSFWYLSCAQCAPDVVTCSRSLRLLRRKVGHRPRQRSCLCGCLVYMSCNSRYTSSVALSTRQVLC
jgi:hypothetical protein